MNAGNVRGYPRLPPPPPPPPPPPGRDWTGLNRMQGNAAVVRDCAHQKILEGENRDRMGAGALTQLKSGNFFFFKVGGGRFLIDLATPRGWSGAKFK